MSYIKTMEKIQKKVYELLENKLEKEKEIRSLIAEKNTIDNNKLSLEEGIYKVINDKKMFKFICYLVIFAALGVSFPYLLISSQLAEGSILAIILGETVGLAGIADLAFKIKENKIREEFLSEFGVDFDLAFDKLDYYNEESEHFRKLIEKGESKVEKIDSTITKLNEDQAKIEELNNQYFKMYYLKSESPVEESIAEVKTDLIFNEQSFTRTRK